MFVYELSIQLFVTYSELLSCISSGHNNRYRSFLLPTHSFYLVFLQYTSADIEAFCNWWETGGREARNAMKATEASRNKLYSSCAINLIDNW